jgi:hypothetical protein
MAVVVDDGFFASIPEMGSESSVSNCEIAWFVVRYEESKAQIRLVPHKVHLTDLAHAVDGLTGGLAVSLEVFEKRILAKLERLSGPSQITPN